MHTLIFGSWMLWFDDLLLSISCWHGLEGHAHHGTLLHVWQGLAYRKIGVSKCSLDVYTMLGGHEIGDTHGAPHCQEGGVLVETQGTQEIVSNLSATSHRKIERSCVQALSCVELGTFSVATIPLLFSIISGSSMTQGHEVCASPMEGHKPCVMEGLHHKWMGFVPQQSLWHKSPILEHPSSFVQDS